LNEKDPREVEVGERVREGHIGLTHEGGEGKVAGPKRNKNQKKTGSLDHRCLGAKILTSKGKHHKGLALLERANLGGC